MVKVGKGFFEGMLQVGIFVVFDKLFDLVGFGGKFVVDKGKDICDYFVVVFFEFNVWECVGVDVFFVGMVDVGFEN